MCDCGLYSVETIYDLKRLYVFELYFAIDATVLLQI